MMRVLHLVVVCDKQTCVAPEGRCAFLATRPIISTQVCTLFGVDLSADDQRHDGKPERCAECKERER